MRILTISNYYPSHPGGIEIVAQNLVTRWRERHQVRWAACDVKDRPHAAAPDDLPLPALNFTEERLGFPYPIPVRDSLVRIFEQVRQCDVVHIHDCLYLASVIAFVASRRYRKPLLVTQHIGAVPYAQAYKNLMQRVAYASLGRLVLQGAEQVVFISERVRQWFESRIRFRRAPLLIPNGVDTRLFHPPTPEERTNLRAKLGLPQNEMTLLFVGRFTQKKGLHLIRELARARPAWTWIMIGQGEIEPREWKLPNLRVVPPLPQSDVRSYYAAADALILPSVGEGLPLTVQESLACGLPVAASHETAFHLRPSPLIELDTASLPAMLQALDALTTASERLDALRKASSEFARQWDWEGVAQKYENLLIELAAYS
jgi:glycosyltransferase involved in cell wall biosynthesis